MCFKFFGTGPLSDVRARLGLSLVLPVLDIG